VRVTDAEAGAMTELKALLTALVRREGSLDAARERLARLLRERPDAARECRQLLQAARRAGLPHGAFAVLDAQVAQAMVPAAGGAVRDTVVLQSPPSQPDGKQRQDLLETVVLETPHQPAAPPDVSDPDVTTLDDDDDATVLAATDADATVLAATGAEATVLPAAGFGGAPPADDYRARRLAVEPDGEATVFATQGEQDPAELGAADSGRAASDDRASGEAAPRARAARGAESDRRRPASTADDDSTALGVAGAFEAETAINHRLLEGAEATMLHPIGPGADSTDPDATELNDASTTAEPTTLNPLPQGDVPYDTLEPALDADGATGSEWPSALARAPDAVAGRPAVTRALREHDKLRGRFELISRLGEGGMGAVWKGRDLLKVEARDRNPYVAIKLLQGDFKEHPEAFIALQRETSKQQRLAHPNIATVYDFDRDDETQTVFMTMEVLEGQGLDSFIRKLPSDGLPADKAMPIIAQLCAGLAYAHGHDLVHSDLKPGNCFVTDEGAVKLLDFGIARASKTKSDAEGETTLFDPGDLGALTPTYATVEMFEGQSPDPRDDIYALAIMAYQLLTGRHPYGKKSAPKALELGFVPAPVDKLSKRQNRGLARALAFHREDRTPSVEEFLADIEHRSGRGPLYTGLGAAAAAVIAALSVGPMADYMNQGKRAEIVAVCELGGIANIRECLAGVRAWDDAEQRGLLLEDRRLRDAVVAHIARGDEQSISETLEAIKPFDLSWQRDIREEKPARDAIVELYRRRILAVFAPEESRYDYAAAVDLMDRLDRLYPDSAQVLTIANALRADQQAELSRLGDRYNQFLAEGRLVSRTDEADVWDVLGLIRQLDSRHWLLSDERLRFRFSELAEQAIEQRDYEKASELLEASAAYAPDDAALNELRFEVETELARITNERRVRQLEARLQGELASLISLQDFQRVRDDLVVLADLSPENSVLVQIRDGLERAFSGELARRIEAADWNGSERLLGEFARLLELPYLLDQRAALSSAERRAGFAVAISAGRDRAIAERRQAIEALLAQPEFTSGWEIRLKVPYKEFIALLPPDDVALEPVREATARAYLQAARVAREAGRFAEALALVRKGKVFHPDTARFDAEEQRIAETREALRLKRLEEARLARIRGLKDDFRAKAANQQIGEAKSLLAALGAERLADDDAFLTDEAPSLLAMAYLSLAHAQAEADNYLDALTLAKAGLELAPGLPELAAAVARFQSEVERRRLELDLRKRFAGADPLDVARTETDLARLRDEYPTRFASLLAEFGESRARLLAAMARSGTLSVPALAKELDDYGALFPEEESAVRTRTVAALEERLLAAPIDSPDRINALRVPLEAFRRLSGERHAALSAALATHSAKTIEALARKSRSKAYRLLVATRATLGDGHAELDALTAIRPPPRALAAALDGIEKGELSRAQGNLDAARREDASHPEIPDVQARLDAAQSEARERYTAYSAAIGASKSTREQSTFDGQYLAITKLWSDNSNFVRLVVRKPAKGACTQELAGFGAKRGGSCYDLIGRRKGPELVVVPASGSLGRAYAIGKYEVTVDDYNLFCNDTGSCEPRATEDRRLPITGITLDEVERYAAWLSAQASERAKSRVVYRLPTVQEWEHAAAAAGSQPERKFNCRVTSSGNIIAGHALVDARSGKPNGWGLTNYVGNAQEWVRSGGGLVARGGAFEDPLARCESSISRNHSGEADEVTGFRLVRELG
jgi:serine/threonine protein kinase